MCLDALALRGPILTQKGLRFWRQLTKVVPKKDPPHTHTYLK